MSDAVRIVAKRRSEKPRELTVLAFVFDEVEQGNGQPINRRSDQLKHPSYPITVASWSTPAVTCLRALQTVFAQRKPPVNLPITGLRTRLEIADERILRLGSDRALGTTGSGSSSHTLLWTETPPDESRKPLNEAVQRWLTNEVSRMAYDEAEVLDSISQLQELARKHLAIETRQRIAQPYQWTTTQSRTAKGNPESYADLADFVARHLEGCAIFPKLPGVRRVIHGDLTSGMAELMTEPIPVVAHVSQDRTGVTHWYSFVTRIRVFSYPGRPGPVVAIEFSRRVWSQRLNPRSGVRRISGYAFPRDSTRALRFTVLGKREPKGYVYTLDEDFDPIAQRYLQDAPPALKTILAQGMLRNDCQLMVGAKAGASGRSVVKVGVPDLDKIDAFDNIAEQLHPLGLMRWHGVQPVETPTRAAADRNEGWTYRASIDDKAKRYTKWVAEARDHIHACYADAHHILIVVQRDAGAEASAIEAERLLRVILGDAIQVTRVPLPADVHGPKNALPGEKESANKRAALRQHVWKSFCVDIKRQMAEAGQRLNGILVIAHEWYAGPAHDDKINQRAARIALITGLGAPVQYLLPREQRPAISPEEPDAAKRTARRAEKAAKQFERRLMNAWLDLAFASQGLLRKGQLRGIISDAQQTTLFPDALDGVAHGIPGDRLPDRILALSVIRRNETRYVRNGQSVIPCAIELDLESGKCQASFAYEDTTSHELAWSELQPLPQVLAALARLGPSPLTTAKTNAQQARIERTQEFFRSQLAAFAQRSTHPLVLIDADTSRSLWPWLQDTRLEPDNVQLAGNFNAQVAWPKAMVARIRTANSPKILWDQTYIVSTQDQGEAIRYRAPSWAEAQLFQLSDTYGAYVYLSFGSAIRLRKRGVSGYRRILGVQPTRGEVRALGKQQVANMEPHTDAWATPTGVEMVIVRPGENEPSHVVALLEWLRQCYAHFGEWSEKPAPLHFVRVLKSYVADFEMEDEDEMGEDNTTSAE